jgi:outer membrane usher protein
MRRHLYSRRVEHHLVALCLTLAALFPLIHSAMAEGSRQLQLEVYINGATTSRIGSFVLLPDRRIAATRTELAEVGLKVPGVDRGDDLVAIDSLQDIEYRYDERTQTIFFKVANARRVTQIYDARGQSDAPVPPRSDYGSVVNYTFFAASTKPFGNPALGFSGGNASLDARLFSPYGTLSQSGIVGSTTATGMDVLRLDTVWVNSNPSNLMTYRAGDVISGGLAWTRPIRLGGLQMQRNFALRPDLVTLPLPAVSGSAAVPSTVDVYINNMKALSQDVSPGPYQMNNIPTLSGGGLARVVVRDAAGRQIETSLPFFTSPKLLRQGLTDFSFEAGFPRLNYATESSSYVDTPVGSASARAGVHDWLTLEGHAEGGAGLSSGGLGAVTSVGSWGVVSLAASGSRFDDAFGFQSYAAVDTLIMGLNIHASSQRTLGTYNDLASVTARYLQVPVSYPGNPYIGPIGSLNTTSLLPPTFLDTISIGLQLPSKSSLNLSYVHLGVDHENPSNIVSISYSRALFADASMNVTAFSDRNDKRNFGVFVGLSKPLGGGASMYTGISNTRDGMNYTFDAAKPIQPEPGGYGWRLRDSEGAMPYRDANATYRSSVGQIEGDVQQNGGSLGGYVQAQGAVAAINGGVFLSNRIDNAFAVVDAGAPDVEVLYENRPAGRTNADGQVLVPGLKPYEKNKIAVDPRGLPVDADAPMTQDVVAPADRSGVVVRFGIKTDVKAAVVVFSDKNGKFISPGSRGQLEGTNERFVVGYDGRAYVAGLRPMNAVVVADAAGECHASFPFAAKPNHQVVIGPVVCQ